ncbi:hypothetical protein XENTR_v10006297 [Xenopus tropicalis]|nr:hypothetical protein XENTR_v10006297 [Xenopus tropicalis]
MCLGDLNQCNTKDFFLSCPGQSDSLSTKKRNAVTLWHSRCRIGNISFLHFLFPLKLFKMFFISSIV